MRCRAEPRSELRGRLVGAALLALAAAVPAYGYLDPGTGSYFLQLVIGGLLGGLFAVGLFWRRILSSVRRLLRPRQRDDRAGN